MRFNIKRKATEYRHVIAGLAVLAVALKFDPFTSRSLPIGSAWLEIVALVGITLTAVAVSGGFRILRDHKRLATVALGTSALFILAPTLIELLVVGYEHTAGEPDKIWLMDGSTPETPIESLLDALLFTEEFIILAMAVTTIVVVAISRPASREELSSLFWFLLPPAFVLISARGVLKATRGVVRRDIPTMRAIYYVSEPLESVLAFTFVLWFVWGIGLVAYELSSRYGVEELSAPGEASRR